MLTTDIFNARCAFLRFQHSLDALEQYMKPLRDDMSHDLKISLDVVSAASRRFFDQANQELFPTYTQVEQVTSAKGGSG